MPMRAVNDDQPWYVALRALWPEPHRINLQARSGNQSLPRFLLLPRPSRATLLVPDRPTRATAAALRNYKSPSTRGARLQAQILYALGRSGLARLSPGRVTVVEATGEDSLLTHFSKLLGEDIVVGIHLGPPRANQKPVVQIMRPNGEAVAFAKVGVNALTRERVDREAKALDNLSGRTFRHLSIPTLLHHGSWGEISFVVLAPVTTWAEGSIDSTVRGKAMRELVRSSATHTLPLSELPWWHRTMAWLLGHCDASEAEKLLDLATSVEERWGGVVVEVGAAHGDWTPWNMTTMNGRAVVWDWERFANDVPVGFDALHYAVEEAVRLGSQSPRRAVEFVASRAGEIAALNGGSSEQGTVVFALYLVGLGERFIADGQLRAGARKGALSTWLLPGLEMLVHGPKRYPGEQ